MNIRETIGKYWVVSSIEELRIRNYNRHDPLAISQTSLHYLAIIKHNEGCTISFIAELTGVSTSAVTMKIRELVKLGYVEKKQSEKDKRSNHLYLTEYSKDEEKKFYQLHKEVYQKISEQYSSEELETFSKVLNSYSDMVLGISHEKYRMKLEKKMDKSLDFENEKIPVLFRKLCLPTVLSMVVSAFYIIVDGIFVGRGIGGDALAAINIVVPIFTVFTGTGLMMGIGASVISALELSKKNFDRANQVLSITAIILVLTMIGVTTILLLFNTTVCRLLGASDAILSLSRDYLGVMMVYSPFFTMAIFLPFFVRLNGAPQLAMASTIFGSLLNIVLDYLFIFTFGMGIRGAALATGIGNIVSVVVLMIFMLKKERSVHFVRPVMELRCIGQVIKIGFSAMLAELCISFSTIAYNLALMKGYGEDAVTAYSILNYIHPLMLLVFIGVGQSIQPIISYNYGLGRMDRVLETLKISVCTTFVLGVMAFIGSYFINESIVLLFLGERSLAFDLAVEGLPLFFANYFFLGVNMVFVTYYQSITQSGKATILTISRGAVFVLVAVLVLPVFWGISGIWLTLSAAELAGIFIAFLLNRKNLNNEPHQKNREPSVIRCNS